MDRIIDTKAYDRDQPVVRPISQGGTSATDPLNATMNLGGIPTAMKGRANGVAPLGLDRKIPIEFLNLTTGGVIPSLNGPAEIFVGQSDVAYDITNFDSKTTYTVSVKYGTCTLVGSRLLYTAPAQACVDILTINGRDVTITVLEPHVVKPTILSPNNNATNTPLTFSALLSDFVAFGISDVQVALEYEIATDAAFTNVVSSDFTSTADEVFGSGMLSKNTTYYMRARQQGEVLGMSEWSDTVVFTTTRFSLPNNLTAIVTARNETVGEKFGTSVVASADASIFAVGAPGYARYANQFGGVFLFRTVNGAVEQFDIISSDQGSRSFGQAMTMSSDGRWLLVSDPNYVSLDTGNANVGRLYMYEITPTGAVLKDSVIPAPQRPELYAGYTLAMSADGSKFVCSVLGEIVIPFTFDGTTIVQQADIQARDYGNGQQCFGFSLSMSPDGSLLFIGEYATNLPGNMRGGLVYAYDNIGGVWTENTVITAPPPLDTDTNSWFGYAVGLSKDMQTLIVGDGSGSPSSIYLYSKVNNVWTLQSSVTPAEWGTLGGEVDQIAFPNVSGLMVISSIYSTSSLRYTNSAWDGDGGAYLYSFDNNGLTKMFEYTGVDPRGGDNMGTSVAINDTGTIVLIGAPNHDSVYGSNANDGVVYVYTSPESPVTFVAPSY